MVKITNERATLGVPNKAQSAAAVKEVERRLGTSGYTQIRDLQCEFKNGMLVVRGQVPSFYLKQIIQTILKKIDGLPRIDNQVKVQA